MKNYFKYISIILLAFSLTACSSFFTSNDDVQYFYVLNPLDNTANIKQPANVNLAVPQVNMPEWLDSSHIVLRRGNNQLDYYAEARWAADAGIMLKEVVVDSLISNQVVTNVNQSQHKVHADYLLVLEVTSFEAYYPKPDAPPVIKVAMHGKLIAMPGGTVHYQFNIENTTAAKSNNMSAIINAFDKSTQACLTELVQHTARGLAVK